VTSRKRVFVTDTPSIVDLFGPVLGTAGVVYGINMVNIEFVKDLLQTDFWESYVRNPKTADAATKETGQTILAKSGFIPLLEEYDSILCVAPNSLDEEQLIWFYVFCAHVSPLVSKTEDCSDCPDVPSCFKTTIEA